MPSAAGHRPTIAFNHQSREHAENWEEAFRELRAQCPRGWSESFGGFWLATRYRDVVNIAQRPENFTTAKQVDPTTGDLRGGVSLPDVPDPRFRAVPNESASPEWDGVRRLLNPRLSPKAVAARQARTRDLAAAVVDQFIESGRFDIVDDLANPLPAMVTMEFLGLELAEWQTHADPFHRLVYTPKDDPAMPEIAAALGHFFQRIDEVVAQRRQAPREDMLSWLAYGKIDDAPLSDELIRNIAFQVLAGGVDTTTALTANVLMYLSRNPAVRERLINEPALLPYAREEFVRYFSPVHAPARTVTEDTEIDGWLFRKGERVLIAYASANRDEAVFADPDALLVDRYPNRHVGFGAGMHRCLGSFLARMMFDAMLSEILLRLPDYRVIEEQAVPYTSIASINGWIRMPAEFTPGRKVGASR